MANTAAKKITYDGKPIQVESAIRDGTGKIIMKYAEYTISTNSTAGDTETKTKNISDFSFGYSNPPTNTIAIVPRIVQIFDASGNEVHADVQITSTQIIITITDAPVSATWTVRVTAW